MTRPTTKLWMIRGSVVIAAALGALFASCTGEGPPRPTCNDLSDAGADAVNIDAYTQVTTDARPIEALGMEPDPGPTCTNCQKSRDYEVMTIADFEDGFAPAWFNYGESGIWIDPRQAGEGRNEDGTSNLVSGPPPPYWGLQVATLGDLPGGERCGSRYALHMSGGRFSSWGGGYVTRFFVTRGEYMLRPNLCGERDSVAGSPNASAPGDPLVNGIGTKPMYMPGTDQSITSESATGCMFFASPVGGQPSMAGFDVSDFEGVSFWARRGPSGQAQLRISLVDDSVSEDRALNTERLYWEVENLRGNPNPDPDEAGALCTRTKKCCRGCREIEYSKYVPAVMADTDAGIEGSPARCDTVVEKRCHVEGERFPVCRTTEDGSIQMWDHRPEGCEVPDETALENNICWTTDPQTLANLWDDDFALCCPPTMENEDSAERNGDPRYGGTECRPYVFLYDNSSDYYCYEEGTVLPEANQNRCGEGFEAAVVVGPEWEFFMVPWSELRRYTPDKPPIDPGGIWQVSFYFSAGYLDTYIDDVGFYRRRR